MTTPAQPLDDGSRVTSPISSSPTAGDAKTYVASAEQEKGDWLRISSVMGITAAQPKDGGAPLRVTARAEGSAVSKDAHALAVPKVPGYEIGGELGRGGMAIVYKARHLGLDRFVALKVILLGAHADAELISRLWTEAQTVARLHHPGIVQVFDSGTHDGLPYCALELLPGGNLAERLARQPLKPREAAELVYQLAKTTWAAHLAGVVHRDLKPGNILFTEDGQPKITDFGLALHVGAGSRLTQTGTAIGTPQYMPPEQARGDKAAIGPPVDIYALGAILYECLTGDTPFTGDNPLDVMHQAMSTAPTAPSKLVKGLPRDLDVICLKCLEKEPQQRYPTVLELSNDLQRFLEDRPIQARPVGEWERLVRWARRNPLVAGLAASVVGIFLIGFAVVTWSLIRAEDALHQAEMRQESEQWEKYRGNVIAGASALHLYNVNAAREFLDSAPLKHRNWEWGYFAHQLDGAQYVLGNPNQTCGIARITPNGNWVALFPAGDHLLLFDVVRRQEVADRRGVPDGSRFSPDGALFAYFREADRTLILHEAVSGRVRATLGHNGSFMTAMAFSPDSMRLVTTWDDSLCLVFDTRTGQVLSRVLVTGGHVRDVSRDGRLAVFTNPRDATLHVVDLVNEKEQAVYRGHEHWGAGAAISPSGDRVVSVEDAGYTGIRLWDAVTGEQVKQLRGHRNDVIDFGFSPDGARLALASRDQTVSLCDGRTGEHIGTLTGHSGWVNSVQFSPDSRRLVTASQDRTLGVWDAATGALQARLIGHSAEVLVANFTVDGAAIVSASRDGTARIWETQRFDQNGILRGHKNYVYHVAFHPDGTQLASASWDGDVRLWDAATGRLTGVLSYGQPTIVSAVAYHPAGRLLASVGRENAVRLWDLSTLEEVHRWDVPIHGWQDGRLAFSPDGKTVAMCGGDNAIHLLDVAGRTEVAKLTGHVGACRDVAFSPDGRWLASGGEDGDHEVRIWDLAASTTVHELRGHTGTVYSLAFNRPGTLLASGSVDGTVRLWDTTTWQPVTTPLKFGSNVYGLAFTPDGTRLACGCADNLIRLWDVPHLQEVAELRGHTDYVHALAFSPDGTRLASASGDFTVRLWDSKSAAERMTEQERKKER